jgi:hypothetical protein
MRDAAKMSLEQVKQWAKSAKARGRPPGMSRRAASVAPWLPTNSTFDVLVLIRFALLARHSLCAA